MGQLVQAWPEHEDPAESAEHADEGPLSWVETDGGEAVRVPTEDIEDVGRAEVGATIAVTVGDEVVDEAAEDGLDPARDVLQAVVVADAPAGSTAPVSPAGTVTDRVTVVMVRPSGTAADTRTLSDVVNAVNGPVAQFWSEQSDGAVKIQVTASTDQRATSLTATCTDPYALWNEAAQRAGWTRGTGEHLLVYVPQTATACSYGLAEIGTSLSSGGRLYVRDVATSVMAHELGHNFGLGHSSELQCNSAVETGSCQVSAYNDWYDVMGYSWDQVGTLNAAQGARLGLLPTAEQATLSSAAGTSSFTLAPLAAASGTRAVRLTSTDGTVYWLEYRQASGRDSWLSSATLNWPGVQSGVTVRRAADQPDTSLLLDPTPSASGRWSSDRQAALPVGTAVSLAGGAFTVTVQSVAAAGAVLQVATRATPIGTAYNAAGGAAGPLGRPTSGEVCGLRGGGCGQQYQGGAIYWSAPTGAHVVVGVVRTRWAAFGWEVGRLGYPITDTVCGLVAGGCAQHFQGGSLYSTAGGPARLVAGNIRDRWMAARAEAGPLGYPTTDEFCGLRGGGCAQHFHGGSVYWAPATGAHLVTGGLRDRWAGLGWEIGRLGYPVTDTVCGLSDLGCYQIFQGESLYSSASTPAHTVGGAIRDRWAATGWEGGLLGYPTTDEFCSLRGGGCAQHFQRGSIYWSPGTGAHAVTGAVRDRWAGMGWELSGLGYPVTETVCGLVDDGCAQHFQFGSLYGSTATPVRFVTGAIRDRWAAAGWERSPLGYPTTDGSCGATGVCDQAFQGGRIRWSTATGAVILPQS